jgi:hypothetical protein
MISTLPVILPNVDTIYPVHVLIQLLKEHMNATVTNIIINICMIISFFVKILFHVSVEMQCSGIQG